MRIFTLLASVALVALFSLLWAVIEWVGPGAGLPGEQVVWIRYAVHLAVLTMFCGWRYRSALVKTSHPWLQFLRSACMFGMPMSFLLAIERMHPNTALTVFWIAPLMLVALDTRAARVPSNWIAGLAAVGGAVLILKPDMTFAASTLVFPVSMAVCFSAYLVLTRRLRDELEATNLFYTAFWVFIAMSFRLPAVWRAPTHVGLVVTVFIGVAGLVALYAVDLAVKRNSPGTIGAAFCLQPVFAALIHTLTTQSELSHGVLAGIVLVFGGIAAQTFMASAVRSEVPA